MRENGVKIPHVLLRFVPDISPNCWCFCPIKSFCHISRKVERNCSWRYTM